MDKRQNNKMPWFVFAGAEGFLKTAHFTLYKHGMGGVANAFLLSFVWTLVVGAIQICVGLFRASQGHSLRFGASLAGGAMLFGVVATYMTVLPAWLSSYAVVGNTLFPFMTAAGVLPGVIFDYRAGEVRHGLRTMLAIAFFLFGTLAYFEFDASLGWNWQTLLAATFAVAAATNEFLARRFGFGAVDPFVMQFWVGLSTILCCVVGLLGFALADVDVFSLMADTSWWLWGIFILFGVLIVPSVASKVKTYEEGRGGGSIVMKKVVMLGVLLVGSFAVEWLFFGVERPWWSVVVFLAATITSYRLLSR